MPRIPVYQSEPILGRGVDPSEMVQGQRSAIRFGAASQDLGEVLGKRAAEIKQEVDNKVSLDTQMKYETWALNDAVEMKKTVGTQAIKQNADGSYRLVSDTQKRHNEKIEEFANGLDNEEQREIFKGLAKKKSLAFSHEAASHVISENGKVTVDLVNSAVNTALMKIQYSGGDPLKIKAARDEAEATMIAVGGEGYKKNAMQRLDMEAMKIQGQFRETKVYSELAAKHGDNADAAIKDLMNPANYADMTIEEKQKLGNIIKSDAVWKQQDTKRKQDDLQGQLLSEFSELKRTGKSRSGWYRKIEELSRSGQVTDEFQRGAISMLNKDIQEAKTGPETNPVAYSLLHEKVARGAASVGEIMNAKGISNAHKNTLIDKFYGKAGAEQKEAETQAKNYIKSQLVSTGPLGNPLPAEHERLFKAYEAIDVHADAARKAGKPWGVEDYMKYAEQLSKFYRPTIQSKVADSAAMFAVPQPTKAQTPIAAPDMKRKPGETIEQWEVRTGNR